MESKVKVLGHSLHQQLVPLPIGMLAAATMFDVWHRINPSPSVAAAASWLIAAGVVTGGLAAIVGWLDWSVIPRDTRAKRIGVQHGIGNAVLIVLFLASWLARRGNVADPPILATVLAVLGFGLALFTAWLGGELVTRMGVGVSSGAHLDAPSSIRQPEPSTASRAP